MDILKKLDDEFKSTPTTHEERGEIQRSWISESAKLNNISTWLPAIQDISKIPIPKTQLIELNNKWLGWLVSDKYPAEEKAEFQKYLESKLDPYFKDKKIFVRVGTFSDKFEFDNSPLVENLQYLSQHVLSVFYSCMLCGAGITETVAIREYVEPLPPVQTIYSGMPLRREIRFFVDFSNDKVLGYSDYWHPEAMIDLIGRITPENLIPDLVKFEPRAIEIVEKILSEDSVMPHLKEKISDWLAYADWYQKQSDIKQYVEAVLPQIQNLAENCQLTGSWSVDIMFNDLNHPFLIDMALMNQSALAEYMVPL